MFILAKILKHIYTIEYSNILSYKIFSLCSFNLKCEEVCINHFVFEIKFLAHKTILSRFEGIAFQIIETITLSNVSDFKNVKSILRSTFKKKSSIHI